MSVYKQTHVELLRQIKMNTLKIKTNRGEEYVISFATVSLISLGLLLNDFRSQQLSCRYDEIVIILYNLVQKKVCQSEYFEKEL